LLIIEASLLSEKTQLTIEDRDRNMSLK